MPTSTVEAINLPFEEASAFFRQKARVPTAHWTDVWRTAHSRSFMVAGAASGALLEDFKAEIQKALNEGTTLEEFRKRFDEIVEKHGWAYNGTPGWRAQIIYETNLNSAYSAGRYAQLTEPETKAAFPYWQYQHSGSAHPRLQHLSWNGLTLRCDDTFWQTHYPPNGWRCGCRVRPVSGHDLRRQGKSEPDEAPPLETREWRNPHTGKTSHIPDGIDPGFDYNPGQAWKDGGQGMPVISDGLKPTPPPQATGPAPIAGLPSDQRPKVFDKIEQADAHWTKISQPIFEQWSADEKDVLEVYKTRAGREINQGLRDNDRPDIAALSGVLAAALERSVLPEAALLHRGIGPVELKLYTQARVGEVVRQPGFVSASLSPDIAGKFSTAAIVEIRVPKGIRGALYVHPLPRVQWKQFEVLLNRGSMFRVLQNSAERIILEAINAE